MFQGFGSMGVPGFCVITAILLSTGALARQTSPEFDGEGYRVILPRGVTGTTKHVIDFDIATFRKDDGTQLLGAYSGLHPDFSERGSRAEKINGLNALRRNSTNSNKQKCSDVLVTIRGSKNFAFSVHFWYCLDSDVDVKQAESIIHSIKPEP
jgi:hypothetical protein